MIPFNQGNLLAMAAAIKAADKKIKSAKKARQLAREAFHTLDARLNGNLGAFHITVISTVNNDSESPNQIKKVV